MREGACNCSILEQVHRELANVGFHTKYRIFQVVEKVERLKNVLSYIAKAGILDCKPRLVEAHLNAVNLVVCKTLVLVVFAKLYCPLATDLCRAKITMPLGM